MLLRSSSRAAGALTANPPGQPHCSVHCTASPGTEAALIFSLRSPPSRLLRRPVQPLSAAICRLFTAPRLERAIFCSASTERRRGRLQTSPHFWSVLDERVASAPASTPGFATLRGPRPFLYKNTLNFFPLSCWDRLPVQGSASSSPRRPSPVALFAWRHPKRLTRETLFSRNILLSH